MEGIIINIVNIFENLINISLMGSVFAFIIFCIRPIIKRFFGPMILSCLWLILIIKLIIPYGPQSELSIYNIPDKLSRKITSEDLQINHSTTDNSQTIDNINFEKIPSDSNITTYSPPIDTSFKPNSNISMKLLSCIWFFGFLIATFLAVMSYFKLLKIKSSMIYRLNKNNYNVLNNALNKLKIKSNIEILVVKNLNSPALCGVLSPKILIPINIFENMNDEDINYIILHELCHYKRKDVLIAWIIYLLKILYWFNPVIFFALNTMRKDCEIACDNMVISNFKNDENLNYGYTILKVFSLINKSNSIIGVSSIANNKKSLKERISMIGHNKKFGIKNIAVGVIVLLIISVLALTSGKSNVQTTTKDNSNDVTDTFLNGKANIKLSNYTGNSKVLIYNSHAGETYSDNSSIIDTAKLLNKNLNKSGMDSEFIECDPTVEYNASYYKSEELIKANSDDYTERILLDIHRDARENSEFPEMITIPLSESASNFEGNLKLAQALCNELNNNGVKARIEQYKNGINHYNQNLGINGLTIDVGTDSINAEQSNYLITELGEALKSVLK